MNDLDFIKLMSQRKVFELSSDEMRKTFFWSDLHFDDLGIIKFSRRPFWKQSSIDPSIKVPDPDEMDKDIVNKLLKVPDGSIIINCGDVIDLNPNNELLIPKLNKALHDKGCKSILVMGNHDYLSDNSKIDYRAYAGSEVDFWKLMGFDIVITGQLLCENYLISHQPICEDVLDKCSADYNIHGHWHDRSVRDSRHISVCYEVRSDGPLQIWKDLPSTDNADKVWSFYQLNIEKDCYLKDPWL